MDQPKRIVHFADCHIGMENYGRLNSETGLNQRVVDFLGSMDKVVGYAIEHEADLLIFAGDAFRTRRPPPTYQREFAKRIRQLSDAHIPTLLLVGNHDVPVITNRASSVDIFETLGVPHIQVAAKPELLRIETKHGLMQVAVVPYPVRQRLLSREEFRSLSQDALDSKVTEMVIAILRDLEGKVDPQFPAVLVGHFSVQNAKWGSERNIMIGRDVTVPLSTLTSPAWDYVALGHIHQHQDLNPENHPPVVYAGSLERVDFGEEKQQKGFCWIEVARGKADWRFIPVSARRFQTIRVDVRQQMDPLAEIQQAISEFPIRDAVVRLMINMLPEQEPLLRDADIAPALEGAFYTQINREVDRTIRDRLSGLEPDEMTPQHLLERYLISRGRNEDEIAPLMKAAERIISEVRDTPDNPS
ncbi:MAG: exonuclease SbcCD subunit D [Anaerolineae bacterium]|nr:exonuclease SbcCD subunit D [Anaerolineae bacterium]